MNRWCFCKGGHYRKFDCTELLLFLHVYLMVNEMVTVFNIAKNGLLKNAFALYEQQSMPYWTKVYKFEINIIK